MCLCVCSWVSVILIVAFLLIVYVLLLNHSSYVCSWESVILIFSSPEQSSGWAFVILECPSSVVRRASCVVNNFVVTTLKSIILIQSSSNLLRIFILKISQTSLNMGGVGSKSRLLGQIFELEATILTQSSSNLHMAPTRECTHFDKSCHKSMWANDYIFFRHAKLADTFSRTQYEWETLISISQIFRPDKTQGWTQDLRITSSAFYEESIVLFIQLSIE